MNKTRVIIKIIIVTDLHSILYLSSYLLNTVKAITKKEYARRTSKSIQERESII